MPKERIGKTQRDHESGVHANRFSNRAARVNWQHSRGETFPKTTCNGKRNRHRVTGKKGKTVMI